MHLNQYSLSGSNAARFRIPDNTRPAWLTFKHVLQLTKTIVVAMWSKSRLQNSQGSQRLKKWWNSSCRPARTRHGFRRMKQWTQRTSRGKGAPEIATLIRRRCLETPGELEQVLENEERRVEGGTTRISFHTCVHKLVCEQEDGSNLDGENGREKQENVSTPFNLQCSINA